ncbi:hypothetical protein GW765_00205 [Candidatus Parcubacteria bacterium]|nr:hypothetical protein [Candidatus Parcubacteria bacterium]
MTLLFLTLLVTILFSVPLHELGHAIALKKSGVDIKEITLLGIGKIIFSFKLTKVFGDTPLNIRLLPLAAFVRPSNISYLRLTSKNPSACEYVSANGIAMNLLLGSLLLFLGILTGYISHGNIDVLTVSAMLTSFFLGIFSKKPLMSSVYVLIGTTILFSGLMIFIFDPFEGSNICKLMLDKMTNAPLTWESFFTFSAYSSIVLGFFNAMPIKQLDGGQLVCGKILKKIKGKRKTRFYSSISVLYSVTSLFVLLYITLFGF